MNSLRNHLIIFFLALIFLPIGLTLWSFSNAFENNITRFVEQATLNILAQSNQQITTLIDSAETVVEYQNDIFKMQAYEFESKDNHASIRELLKANIVNLGVLQNIGVTSIADHRFFMSYKDTEGGLVTMEVKDDGDYRYERYWTEQQLATGTIGDTASEWQETGFMVESRPWFKQATEQEAKIDFELIWTDPYVFKQSKQVGITAAKAINTPGEGYRPPFAVAFADISLAGISHVLRSLEVGDGSQLMLVNKDNLVLASSLGAQEVYQRKHFSLPTADELGKEFMDSGIWKNLQDSAPRLSGKKVDTELQSFNSHNGTEYFARVLPLQKGIAKNFGWNLWVFIPKDSLLSDYYRSRRDVIWYTAIAGVAALLLSLFIFTRVGSQLGAVIKAFSRVQEGDLQTPLSIRRPYSEINALVVHFNQMLKALRENTMMQKLISKNAMQDISSSAEEPSEDRKILSQSNRTYRTMLFSDIRGFTKFSEKKQPEEVVRMLNEYLGLHADIIEKHGGDVDKYVGDEVVATFDGANAESRAIKAACEICREIKSKPREHNLDVGIGIHCGHVVSGYIGSEGRADFTSIGSTVNYTARLCDKAGPGEIWVSEAVYEKCCDSNDLSFHADVDFKGFSVAQKVYLANY